VPVVDLEDFCRREHPRLVGALTLYCGDPHVAAELAQEALARACDHWGSVRQMEAPGAWVHRVAMNLAGSLFRRRAAERRASARVASGQVEDFGPDRADVLAVRAAVAALPDRQRTALVLRYYSDLSVEQTADAMRCAPGTVKSLTSQALAALRRRAGLSDLEEPSLV
jgi:RNA polymerase sigma-70 factor (sigma-E family)